MTDPAAAEKTNPLLAMAAIPAHPAKHSTADGIESLAAAMVMSSARIKAGTAGVIATAGDRAQLVADELEVFGFCIRPISEASSPPTEPAAEPITSETALTMGRFHPHAKTALTQISDFTVPPGVPYQTPEGLRAEDEPTRIAFDVQGGVYPIRESVFAASYVRGGPCDDQTCAKCWDQDRRKFVR